MCNYRNEADVHGRYNPSWRYGLLYFIIKAQEWDTPEAIAIGCLLFELPKLFNKMYTVHKDEAGGVVGDGTNAIASSYKLYKILSLPCMVSAIFNFLPK